MAHYSEMDFLFEKTNREDISKQLNSASYDSMANVINEFELNIPKYVIFKGKSNFGINEIQKHYKENIYNSDNRNIYVKLIQDFNISSGNPGAGLKLKASHFAYLRDLGVYPINRMIILRRFPEGNFTYENLEEMTIEPISTIIGWLKPDQNFGTFSFNENWTTTNKRFDILLAEKISEKFGIPIKVLMPVPDFAQGMLFEFYKRGSFLNNTEENLSVNGEGGSPWGLTNIPVGDPNVLQEGPYRDPNSQNIQSEFSFELETTYEQKFIGNVDPGSAMLDILDNMLAMGTSDMTFFWGDGSPIIKKARKAAEEKANELNQWWQFITEVTSSFWESIKSLYTDALVKWENIKNQVTKEAEDNDEKAKETQTTPAATIEKLLQSIITSTIAIYRFELRGSIELMTGGNTSSTPWHITIGNPYTPWLSTNHIVVKSARIESSHELGFNDMPQWLKVTFNIQFSRALGKQEIMRMFNNSYRRTYAYEPVQGKGPNNQLNDVVVSAEKKIFKPQEISGIIPNTYLDTKTLNIRK